MGNGGAAWEGPPEPGSPTGPRPRPRSRGPPLRPPSPPGLRHLPVHCRTGQSFAPKNRATQPASHTSGEKMAARARRKLPKVAERTGQRAAAERAERAGARRRETSGGGTGTGGVGASAVGCLRLPARLLPPSATRLLQWRTGRPGFPSVGGVSGTASSLHPVCLRLARAAGLLSGSLHFSLQPQDGLPPSTKANPSPSQVTLHRLSPRENTLGLHPTPCLQTVHPQKAYPTERDPSPTTNSTSSTRRARQIGVCFRTCNQSGQGEGKKKSHFGW